MVCPVCIATAVAANAPAIAAGLAGGVAAVKVVHARRSVHVIMPPPSTERSADESDRKARGATSAPLRGPWGLPAWLQQDDQ
jgi:hypothetical protein